MRTFAARCAKEIREFTGRWQGLFQCDWRLNSSKTCGLALPVALAPIIANQVQQFICERGQGEVAIKASATAPTHPASDR
jgi:hypothetical protein